MILCLGRKKRENGINNRNENNIDAERCTKAITIKRNKSRCNETGSMKIFTTETEKIDRCNNNSKISRRRSEDGRYVIKN